MKSKTIYHFNDLSEINKNALLDHISENFSFRKSFNYNPFCTCYNLKQHFKQPDETQHITNICFAEAMILSGDDVNVIDPTKQGEQIRHRFNVYVKKRNRK